MSFPPQTIQIAGVRQVPDAIQTRPGVVEETGYEFIEVGLGNRSFQPGKTLGIEVHSGAVL